MKKEAIVRRPVTVVKQKVLTWGLRFKFCSWFFNNLAVCSGVSCSTPAGLLVVRGYAKTAKRLVHCL